MLKLTTMIRAAGIRKMQLKLQLVPFWGRAAVIAAAMLPFVSVAANVSYAAPAGETPWAKSFHAEARLIAGNEREQQGRKVLLAGIHLKLDKEWKTYWRSPGDAGLPPSFNWSQSRNLKSARVLWPAPQRFADPYGSSIGYIDEVILPILIEPEDASKPVELAVNFEYAVCKDICVPADAKLAMKIGGSRKSSMRHHALLKRYVDQVPSQMPSGASSPSLHNVEIDLASSKPHITIDVLFPGGEKGADIFVEGPKFFYIPLPQKVKQDPEGRIRFSIDLTKGDEPADLKGKTLTFTMVSKAGHAETTRNVD